jgi:hypothetical protein
VRIVHVNVCEADRRLVFVTVMMTRYAPGVLGIPEMTPVAVPRATPDGRPAAE